MLKKVTDSVLDLVYPRRCPVCMDILQGEARFGGICISCRGALKYVPPPVCLRCGKHVDEEEQEYCTDCRRRSRNYLRGFPVFIYDGAVKDSVLAFKYKNKREFANFYAKEIVRRYGRELLSLQADGIVPVPVHPSRFRKRGYNQAAVLAAALSREINIPLCDGELIRVVKTHAQKDLDDKERYNNLKKAFKRKRNGVKLETVILVDDIYTSGATVEACAGILKKTGVKRVYYTSICIGRGG